eukprot:6173544-Pleurochrysis_carterae.AAC.2
MQFEPKLKQLSSHCGSVPCSSMIGTTCSGYSTAIHTPGMAGGRNVYKLSARSVNCLEASPGRTQSAKLPRCC